MKTIGLIGGMSWESTVTYYQIINEVIKFFIISSTLFTSTPIISLLSFTPNRM